MFLNSSIAREYAPTIDLSRVDDLNRALVYLESITRVPDNPVLIVNVQLTDAYCKFTQQHLPLTLSVYHDASSDFNTYLDIRYRNQPFNYGWLKFDLDRKTWIERIKFTLAFVNSLVFVNQVLPIECEFDELSWSCIEPLVEAINTGYS